MNFSMQNVLQQVMKDRREMLFVIKYFGSIPVLKKEKLGFVR